MALRSAIPLIAIFVATTSATAGDADSNGAPDARTAQHLLLTGQAFDHMGGGVVDAQVAATLKSSGESLGATKTNQYGDFEISADEPHTGTAIVTVKKPYHQDIVVEVELGGADGPPFVDASMVGDVVLVGRITERREGKPVPNAKLRIESGYNERNAESDADGAFRIENLPPGPVAITIEAARFARKRLRIDAVETADPQVVVLDPERIAHLHITDELHQPIAGVGVECLDEPARDYRHEISDERGRVVVRGLRFDAKQLRVRLSHERYVSATEFDRSVDLPEDVNVSTHGLVMRQAGIVMGAVTDAATGKPLYGARLSAGRVLSDRQPRAWTEFDGSYRLVGVTPGRTVITVHRAGHAPQLSEVQVHAAQETKVDFALAAARIIAGTVVDADDKPIAGVYIRATRWAGNDTLGLQAMADDAGKFEIIDAPRDAFEIALYAPGFKPLLDQAISPQQNAYTFQLALDPRKGPGVGGSGPPVGSDAPNFTITTLSGEKIELAKLQGKTVVLDFWATWCSPCVGEIPHLVATHDAYGRRDDFVMLSISIDDDASRVREFVAARKMDWLHAAGADSGAQAAADRYEVTAIPALFIIDRAGKIAQRNLHGAAIREQVGKLLDADKNVAQ